MEFSIIGLTPPPPLFGQNYGKGTGDVKTWGHIGVKNDLKFVHDIWNFARMRILDQSNFPINFKCSLSVHLSVCPSVNPS